MALCLLPPSETHGIPTCRGFLLWGDRIVESRGLQREDRALSAAAGAVAGRCGVARAELHFRAARSWAPQVELFGGSAKRVVGSQGVGLRARNRVEGARL